MITISLKEGNFATVELITISDQKKKNYRDAGAVVIANYKNGANFFSNISVWSEMKKTFFANMDIIYFKIFTLLY